MDDHKAERADTKSGDRRNARMGVILAGVVAGMIGLSFASVPLYRVFCQVTGYGGTTQVAETAPGAAAGRIMRIQFNSDVDPGLPWSFRPAQREVRVRIGEPAMAYFIARNLADEPTVGAAVYNVTPLKVGGYFDKIQCFCFDQQRLEPGQEVKMAVNFFVDPSLMDDRNLDDVKTITLSYTFFRQAGSEGKPKAGGDAGAQQASAARPEAVKDD
jgi:cytochrome c oxidase assembly protein subunit 11